MIEDPPFVEDLHVRQFVLEDTGVDLSAGQDEVAVVISALDLDRRTDADGRPVRRRFGEHGKVARAIGHEGRADGEVLRLIARQEHLGQSDKVGARLDRRGPGRLRLLHVSGEIPDGRVQLRNGYAECCGHVPRLTSPERYKRFGREASAKPRERCENERKTIVPNAGFS